MMKRVILYLIIYIVAGVQLSAQELTFKDESLADVLTAIRDSQEGGGTGVQRTTSEGKDKGKEYLRAV